MILVFGWELSTDLWRGVFTQRESEQGYLIVDHEVGRITPPNAIVLSMLHSGSLRFYAGRMTMRYDILPPESLDTTIEELRARGSYPYILLERWEEPIFRARFGPASAIGRLDWPPIKRWDSPRPVALYDPAGSHSP
jgi:hypothetical protein